MALLVFIIQLFFIIFLNIKFKTIKFIIATIDVTNVSSLIVSNGTIENQHLKYVKQKKKNTSIAILKANLNLENGNFLCSLFRDLASVNRKHIPTIPVEITHKLEYTSFAIIPFLLRTVIIIILSIEVKAGGTAFEITLRKKWPFIRSLFGSSASKNDGIPIVTILIRLS